MASFEIKAIFKVDGSDKINKAFKEISKATGDLDKSFDKFGKSIQTVGKNFAIAGAAIATVSATIFGVTAKFASEAGEIKKLSDQTGISTNEIRKYAAIAEEADISQDAIAKGLQRLARQMTDLKDPTSAASKEIAGLDAGLAAALQGSSSIEQAFNSTIATLRVTGDEGKRAAISFALFGRSGLEIGQIAQLSNTQIENLKNNTEKFGLTLTDVQEKSLLDFDSSLDSAKLSIRGLALQFSTVMAPSLSTLTDLFTEFVAKNRQGFIDFVSSLTSQVFPAVLDFFTLLTTSGKAEVSSAKVREIYETVVAVGEGFKSAFGIARGVLDALAIAVTPIALLLGFDSGLGFIVTVLALKFSGLFAVFTSFLGVVKAVGVLVAVLSSNFLALGGVSGLLATAMTGLTGIIGAAITAFKAFALVILANPLTLFIAAIVAVAAAIYLLIDNTIGWTKAWEILKGAFTATISFIVDALKNLATLVSHVGTALLASFAEAISKVPALLAGLSSLAAAWILSFVDLFKTALDGVFKSFQALGEQIKSSFGAVFDFISSRIKAVIDDFLSSIRNIAGAVKSLFSSDQKSPSSPPPLQKFSTGGMVKGAGTKTSDSILARLSAGEFVVKADMVRKFGADFFNRLNSGIVPRIKGYASGGLVESSGGFLNTAFAVDGGSQSFGRPLNLILPNGDVISTRTSEKTVENLQRSLRKSTNSRAGTLPMWY